MWPEDLMAITTGMDNLKSDIFGANQRPFTVWEVIDQGGEAVKCADYLGLGRYTNFNYGAAVAQVIKYNGDWKLVTKTFNKIPISLLEL